jgi:hypothetical protein
MRMSLVLDILFTIFLLLAIYYFIRCIFYPQVSFIVIPPPTGTAARGIDPHDLDGGDGDGRALGNGATARGAQIIGEVPANSADAYMTPVSTTDPYENLINL